MDSPLFSGDRGHEKIIVVTGCPVSKEWEFSAAFLRQLNSTEIVDVEGEYPIAVG